MRFQQKFAVVLLALFVNACATYKPQYKDENKSQSFPSQKIIEHSFYLIGDGGNSPLGDQTTAIKAFKQQLNNASKKSTALFLGDNIYPAGLPKKDHHQR